MAKIYVASSWRNEAQPYVVEKLVNAGHAVYDFRNPFQGDKGFHWSDIDPAWQDWTAEEYIEALKDPIANRGFHNDFMAMKWADTFVLVLPSGRSAHLETGWAAGRGKKTAIYLNGEHEPELMVKMLNLISNDLNEIVRWANGTTA